MIAAAYADNAAPLLTVTNLGRSGGFSGEIAHALFTDKAAQDALFENIFSVLRLKNYYGVNFNIEYVHPYDRDSYSQFLRRAADELHSRGYYPQHRHCPEGERRAGGAAVHRARLRRSRQVRRPRDNNDL